MRTNTFSRLAGGALLAGSIGAALAAADISMIQANPATAALEGGKATVNVVVSGSASSSDRCGYFVEYGDGAAGDSRVIERENGNFTRPHERVFRTPGTYTIKASGKSVKTTGPCRGSTSVTVTILPEPARAARRTGNAVPACPEGWSLNEKSVNWRTGAFTCTPKAPAELVCGEGLRYFERDGLIGCRSSRRD